MIALFSRIFKKEHFFERPQAEFSNRRFWEYTQYERLKKAKCLLNRHFKRLYDTWLYGVVLSYAP